MQAGDRSFYTWYRCQRVVIRTENQIHLMGQVQMVNADLNITQNKRRNAMGSTCSYLISRVNTLSYPQLSRDSLGYDAVTKPPNCGDRDRYWLYILSRQYPRDIPRRGCEITAFGGSSLSLSKLSRQRGLLCLKLGCERAPIICILTSICVGCGG